MRNHYAGIVAALVVPVIVNAVGAQTCVGTASFSAGTARIGAGAQFTDGAKAYGASLGAGTANVFGKAGVSRTEYDDVSEGATVFDASVGASLDVNQQKTIQLCPLVGFSYQSGPDIETGFGTINLSAHTFAFGGSIGGTIPVSPGFDLVPFGGAAYQILKASGSFAGQSGSDSENYTLITVGAGFVINHIFTLQPTVNFPVGLDGGKSAYGIAFSLNFGSPAKK